MAILKAGLYFRIIGIIVANMPTMEIMDKSERQTVNHWMDVVYKEAVLNSMAKKLTDKTIVSIGICFPIRKPNGKKANIAKAGI
jgi:hypothetical protein